MKIETKRKKISTEGRSSRVAKSRLVPPKLDIPEIEIIEMPDSDCDSASTRVVLQKKIDEESKASKSGKKKYGNKLTAKGQRRLHPKLPRASSRKKEGRFSCSHCTESFIQKGYLTIHKRTHTSKSFTCPLCQRTFARNDTLAVHIRCHVNEKSFKCPKCTFSSVTKGALTRHDNEKHQHEKSYVCKECTKSFTRKENFYSHNFRIHNGGRTE